MKRRDFLKTAAALPVALLVPAGLAPSVEEKTEQTPSDEKEERIPLVGEIIQHGRCEEQYRLIRPEVKSFTRVWVYKGWAVVGAPRLSFRFGYTRPSDDAMKLFWYALDMAGCWEREEQLRLAQEYYPRVRAVLVRPSGPRGEQGPAGPTESKGSEDRNGTNFRVL